MSSYRNSEPSNETPILHIDATTFHVAVTAVVTVVLANISFGNANTTGKGVDNSDCCMDPGSQQMRTVTDLQSCKTKKKKRKRQAQKGRKRSQRLAMLQQQVATPAISALIGPYKGKHPKFNKCSFHHNGTCHEMQCYNCHKIGHHARSCGPPARPITQVPDIGVSPAYYGGGKTVHYKRNSPKRMNKENSRVYITLSRHLTSTTDASISQICHQCSEIGHLKKDCPITKNSSADGKIQRITAAGETTSDPR